jgi:hypothetical protein
MTIKRIGELRGAKPFHPFIMHLADGRDISVGHPECMALGPGGRTVVVFHPDDSLNIVDLLLVTDVEIGHRNGSRRRRRTK